MKKDWKRFAVGIPAAIIMSPAILAGVIYQCIAVYFSSGRELGSALYSDMMAILEK